MTGDSSTRWVGYVRHSPSAVIEEVPYGGFQLSAQGLATQTRFGLDPIIFLINNGASGVEHRLADSTVSDTVKSFYEACHLHPGEYSTLAAVFGCQGWEAATYGELDDASRGTGQHDSPSIIEVFTYHKSNPVKCPGGADMMDPGSTVHGRASRSGLAVARRPAPKRGPPGPRIPMSGYRPFEGLPALHRFVESVNMECRLS